MHSLAPARMRRCRLLCVLLLFASVSVYFIGCSGSPPPSSINPESVSAWWWRMEAPPQSMPPGFAYDRLYVDAGAIIDGTGVSRWTLPEALPAADAYVLLFRVESAQTPPREVIPALLDALHAQIEAVKRQSTSPIWGMQIDFDCPTARLDEYAQWLAALRNALPEGCKLSITGLLTWYRGDGVRDLLAQVDEHIPQFYDLSSRDTKIAAPIDPAEWGLIFNTLAVPYRLGTATFGRLSKTVTENGKPHRYFLHAPAPLLFANPQTSIQKETDAPSGERHVQLTCDGEPYHAVIPSADVLTRARDACRTMGGWCDGVVLFRHPGEGETLVLSPQEIHAATAANATQPEPWLLETQDGGCASSLRCTDVFISPPDRFATSPQTITLTTSAPLAYTMPLIPNMPLPVAAAGPESIRVTVPPYLGLARIPVMRMFHRKDELTVTMNAPPPSPAQRALP